jgi:hypothetical protein
MGVKYNHKVEKHYMKNTNRRHRNEMSLLMDVSYLLKGGAPTCVICVPYALEEYQRHTPPMRVSD